MPWPYHLNCCRINTAKCINVLCSALVDSYYCDHKEKSINLIKSKGNGYKSAGTLVHERVLLNCSPTCSGCGKLAIDRKLIRLPVACYKRKSPYWCFRLKIQLFKNDMSKNLCDRHICYQGWKLTEITH